MHPGLLQRLRSLMRLKRLAVPSTQEGLGEHELLFPFVWLAEGSMKQRTGATGFQGDLYPYKVEKAYASLSG